MKPLYISNEEDKFTLTITFDLILLHKANPKKSSVGFFVGFFFLGGGGGGLFVCLFVCFV